MYLIPLVASNDKVLTIFELLFGNFLLSSAEASFDKNEKAEFCWYFGGDWSGFWGFWELWESFWDFQVYWSSKFVCCLALFPWVMRNISPILISLEESVVQPWGWFPEKYEKNMNQRFVPSIGNVEKPNYVSVQLSGHSVLEWIWIKGSYLSQWLPQGERGPPKESKSRWIEILYGGSQFT